MISVEAGDLLVVEGLLDRYAGLQQDDAAHTTETPRRFLSMLDELTSHKDCNADCIKFKDFAASSRDMVVVQAIPFSSVCAHHVVPFVGFAHVGYVPSNRIAGLSKFARTVEHFARRLSVQEELTFRIADYLASKLQPEGIAVVTKAEHLCMTIRGAQAPGTETTVARMTGVFEDHQRTAKQEFLSYVNGRH